MSVEKASESGTEWSPSHGHVQDEKDTENDVHVGTEHTDIESADHISQVTSHDDVAPLSREVSLSRTKSRASNVIARVASRMTTRSIKDPGPAPDGGFHAWLQCFCGWLAISNTWGFAVSFGAFQTYYAEILPQSPSTISWIGSVQACLIFFIGTFSGRALDAGLFLPTVTLGIVIQLVGIFTMSFSTQYWQLLITQGFLTGVGGGLFFCPAMGVMSTYFVKKRGLAIGIATTGNSVGGIVYPVIVRQLLGKIGFGWTVRVLGLLNLVTLAFVIVFMKPRLPPRKTGPLIDWTALQDKTYVLFVLGTCFMFASTYFAYYYIASFARDIVGMPYTDSLNLLIIVNGVGIPTRILPGFVADRFGALNTYIPLVAANLVLLIGWLGVTTVGGFYAWTIVYGLFVAAYQSLFPSTVGRLHSDLSKAGTRLGMAFSTASFSALVGGPIGGAILQADHGRYWGPLVWAIISMAIGVAMVVVARYYKKGWSLTERC